ncbi:MAG: 3-dehydroquinate synthase [Muribaculaceae bacterium]|nr:3-dehydroquinate synthase [Muribaculaceae bacterium]
MNASAIVFTDAVAPAVERLIAESGAGSIYIIADHNTERLCLPLLLRGSALLQQATVLTTPAGDRHKTLAAAAALWDALSARGATRSSIAVCLGGGMVTDLGGFVASTFKRGIPYINVPTTLLGAVDASVGGKTGINHGGLKNEVGVFAPPYATVAGTCFFDTLPREQLLSGYGEVLKHALLTDAAAVARAIAPDALGGGSAALMPVLRDSIATKMRIVASDPREKGPRKALNLGHTAGHALESLALTSRKPLPHGHAVAFGCVVALVLSRMLAGMDSDVLYAVAAFVREHYGPLPAGCADHPELLRLMHHDKKNNDASGPVNFVLLNAPGRPAIDTPVADTDITAALDIASDLL